MKANSTHEQIEIINLLPHVVFGTLYDLTARDNHRRLYYENYGAHTVLQGYVRKLSWT